MDQGQRSNLVQRVMDGFIFRDVLDGAVQGDVYVIFDPGQVVSIRSIADIRGRGRSDVSEVEGSVQRGWLKLNR
jgi:hypothetical protein